MENDNPAKFLKLDNDTKTEESLAIAHAAPDDQHLLTIFPKEIWCKILGNVNTAEDYHQITSCSSMFQTLLEPLRVKILLSNVLLILLNINKLRLEFQDFLNLRRVCVGWKLSVDDLLCSPEFSSRYLNYSEGFEEYDDDFSDLDDDDEAFESEYKRRNVFAKFQNHFDATHLNTRANPFLLREIQVTVPDELEKPYIQAFVNFLPKYGHHIWKCTVEFENELRSQKYFYQHLNKILSCMPNLREFRVDDYTHSHRERGRIKYEIVTLPNLPQLKTIHLEYVPGCVINQMMASNGQIEVVKIVGTSTKEYLEFYLACLPNLKELAIELADKQDFAVFCTAQVNCRPTKLELTVQNATKICVDDLFQNLRTKFGDNLSELHLSLLNAENLPYSCSGLSLSNLKALILKMDFPACIDFILPLKQTLEHLSINILKPKNDDDEFELASEREVEDDVIEIYKNWKTLHRSNLWQIMPRLKSLKVKCDRFYECTRDIIEYKRKQENMSYYYRF